MRGAPGAANWAPVAGEIARRVATQAGATIGDRLLLCCGAMAQHRCSRSRLDGGNVIEVPRSSRPTDKRGHAEDLAPGSVIVMEESLIEQPTWSRLDLATGSGSCLSARRCSATTLRDTRRSGPAPVRGMGIDSRHARYARGTPLDGSAPCLLYGYGAYEASSDPEFSLGLPSLLDRGVVYAIAHIRGGGEGGRNWWQQGRLRSKPTTFTDFIDVADWLAGSGGSPVVDPARIVSRGLSAGGLLQGAVYSMRPDRWRAVVAEVPFVDCVTTMLDPSIPLTINEWDEWGDPRDPDDYACMRSYSPYDNPPVGSRPALLVTGAVNDPRVAVRPASGSQDSGPPRVRTRADSVQGRTRRRGSAPARRAIRAGELRAEVHAFVLSAMGIA